MKHKVSDLSGALLDAAVAMAEGWERQMCEGAEWWFAMPPEYRHSSGNAEMRVVHFQPSTEWRDGGPIIDREQICLVPPEMRPAPADAWRAEMLGTLVSRDQGGRDHAVAFAQTPLVAAMRAYVASKLGEEVELP